MNQDSNTNTPILILCRDLLFVSKITGTASAEGAVVKVIRDPAKLAGEANSRRMIVDLTQEGFIDAAARWKQSTGGHVVGFAGHADVQTIESAKAAGIDRVMTRGEFSANIASVLRG